MVKKYDEVFSNCSVPKSLSSDEITKLFIMYNKGDKNAKDTIVSHNIRLVFYEVNNKFYNTKMDTEDLVSIGLIGLLKAVNTFDVTKNFKFATYAVRCIDNEIKMALRKNNSRPDLISLNNSIYQDMNKSDNRLSLEEMISDNKDFVQEIIEDVDLKKRLKKIIYELSDYDSKIICLYFGFNGYKRIDQKEISNMLGITQGCVSRTIKRILNDIKKELENNKMMENNQKIIKKRLK